MIWINPPYEDDKVSMITVTECIEKQARYIRQGGSEHYAVVDFVIEPCQGHIGFKNEALIQDDLKGNKEWQYHKRNLAIGNFKFKLKSITIHHGDSKVMDFKIATYIGLREIFKNVEAKSSSTT